MKEGQIWSNAFPIDTTMCVFSFFSINSIYYTGFHMDLKFYFRTLTKLAFIGKILLGHGVNSCFYAARFGLLVFC